MQPNTQELRVYIVRHGESTNNVLLHLEEKDYDQARTNDPQLSQKGVLQSRLAAELFQQRKIPISLILCSPLSRAIQTAEAFAGVLKVPIKIVQNIYERGGFHLKGQGCPGKSRAELQAQYPNHQLDERITEHGWYFSNALETNEEYNIRIKQTLNELSAYESQNIILIGHGNLTDGILGEITGRDPNSQFYFFHQNTGISLITYSPQFRWGLDYFNDYSHLTEHQLKTGEDLKSANLDRKRY